MEVYAINTGYMRMKSGFTLFPLSKSENRYPVLVFLIKIEGKVLLFDTGISDRITDKLGIFEKFLVLEDMSNIVNQLSLMDVKVQDIDYVINSHLHFDHCSNNNFFKDKPILVQEKEYIDYLEAKRNPMYIKDFDKDIDFVCINGKKYFEFTNTRVCLHDAYGHSKGHQILTLEDETNFVAFLADLCYMQDGVLKPIEVEGMENYNTSVKTIEWIDRLLESKKSKNTKLFFSHEINYEGNTTLFDGVEKYIF